MAIQVCSSCFQGVSNPVCEKCYTKQLAFWLKDYAPNNQALNKIVKKIKSDFSYDQTDTACINCEQEKVSICTYCYFFKIERILRNSKLPEEIMDSFLEVFNYPLYKDLTTDDEY